MDEVDVSCATILQLLENTDFFAEVFDGLVTLARVGGEVHVVDVDNLYRN